MEAGAFGGAETDESDRVRSRSCTECVREMVTGVGECWRLGLGSVLRLSLDDDCDHWNDWRWGIGEALNRL
jgi:hypothetical protein